MAGLLALNALPPWPSRDPKTALDAWRLAYMPVVSTPTLGRVAGRAMAKSGLPAETEAFLDRLDGERGHATERLYRTFLLRELPGLMRGRYSAADFSVAGKLLFGSRDLVLTTRAARDAAAQADLLELELVADAGHFIVDEKPGLVADRLLGLLPRER